MQTVETLFSDLAVLEMELELAAKRREDALKLAERASALPRVPAEYFRAGQSSEVDEDEWWAKQFGNRTTAPVPPRKPRPAVQPASYVPSIWGWQ